MSLFIHCFLHILSSFPNQCKKKKKKKNFFQTLFNFKSFPSCAGLYIIAKGFDVIDKASLAALAVIHQMQNSSYGTAVTPEEAAAAPSRECAICQEDARHPLRLSCGHSCFCAECIEEWLARESTCPICRQEVRRATLKQRGDGATSLFPVLC